jgi:exoribonuclease II
MSEPPVQKNSFVLYKNHPARIAEVNTKKILLEMADGKAISVRPKDVTLLHPGPLTTLAQLTAVKGEMTTARELLAGETTTLAELSELAFDTFTPQTAWTIWQLVEEGLYFSGTPDAILVHTAEAVAEFEAARATKAAEEQAWAELLARVEAGEIVPEDGRFLQDVVAVAHRQHKQSKLLKALKLAESEESAHQLLLKLGYWDETHNPYPVRAGLPATQPGAALPDLPDEPRRDLTHLAAFAIDDAGSTDPDDAISWHNGRFWIHIADVATLVTPDSPADVEARARGANSYLPEGVVTMLPEKATAVLGLGLTEISPALSFGLTLNDAGEIIDTEITPSWVKVTRISYEEADARLHESPLREMAAAAKRYEQRRQANGAVNIDLPEVKVKVTEGMVEIRPLPNRPSRDLVRDAMLMTGEAVARFAFEHNIPLPYTIQEAPAEELPDASTPSQFFALRRKMTPSQQSSQPGAHFGLGMGLYAQATSPLRRYLDMVVHQQIRSFLRGGELLDTQAVMERVGAADAISRDVRWVERQSVRHWSLVYLLQNPDWMGEGIVVDRRGKQDVVLFPELAFETRIFSKKAAELDSLVLLKVQSVNLPQLDSTFQTVD